MRRQSLAGATAFPAARSPPLLAPVPRVHRQHCGAKQIAEAAVGLPVNAAASTALSVAAEKGVLNYYKNVSYLQTYFDVAFPVNVGNAIDSAIANFFAGQGNSQSIIQAVAQAAKAQ